MSWQDTKNKNAPVIVKRRTEKAVDEGIKDLLARGYVVIKRGTVNDADQGYSAHRTRHLTCNLNSATKTNLEPIDAVKFYAVLKRT